MNLSGILSIAGKSGLYKVIGQTKNGVVVESLEDGKRFPTYSHEQVSALEEISIYGESEDVPLSTIFDAIFKKEGGKECISHKKSAVELKAYFESVFPEYDEERVYISDIKKVYRWYNALLKQGLLEAEAEEEVVEETPEKPKKAAEKKPAKKAKATKKTADKADKEEKPKAKKKAPAKKKPAKKADGSK